jgi:DNA polymerase-3 subunit gamma/tau
MVVLSKEEGGPTLAATEAAKRESAFLDARSDPAVAAILAKFPGAKIIDVRIPNAPEAPDEPDLPPDAAPDDDDELDF